MNPDVAVSTRNVAGLVIKRRSTLVAGGSNWVESNWTYDALGRVDTQIVKSSTVAQIAAQDLDYFGNDDPKQIAHSLGSNSKTFGYTYDRRHQLLTAVATPSSYFSGTYTYGAAGRLATASEAQTINPPPPGTEVKPRNVNYVYGGADPEQVTALTNVSGGATYASFSYDAAGNMTAKCANGTLASCTGANKERFDYVYDGKDQLRRVTRRLANVVTGSEEYWYDNVGNRIAIVKRNAAGAKTEMISFIGDTQTHYDSVGAVTHVYSNVSLGTPVARIKRTADTLTTTEYQFHGLGNSTLATYSSTGTINTSFRYSPWGVVLEATDAGAANGAGKAAHRRRHNDKYVDELSTLAYYGARYYDNLLIGWTQADPLYLRLPDAASMSTPRRASLYQYTLQNPLRYLDPDGRNPSLSISRYHSEAEARNTHRKQLEADASDDWMMKFDTSWWGLPRLTDIGCPAGLTRFGPACGISEVGPEELERIKEIVTDRTPSIAEQALNPVSAMVANDADAALNGDKLAAASLVAGVFGGSAFRLFSGIMKFTRGAEEGRVLYRVLKEDPITSFLSNAAKGLKARKGSPEITGTTNAAGEVISGSFIHQGLSMWDSLAGARAAAPGIKGKTLGYAELALPPNVAVKQTFRPGHYTVNAPASDLTPHWFRTWIK